jgi:hypothetical protein
LIQSCFSLNRLPKINGIYVSYPSNLIFLFCSSLRGLKNSFFKKRKADILSTLRTEKRTVWYFMFPYNDSVLRTLCTSHVTHEILSDRWSESPALRTPHSEDYSVTYSASALPAPLIFLSYVLNPCPNCHFRIFFTLKLSLNTHTTAKC